MLTILEGNIVETETENTIIDEKEKEEEGVVILEIEIDDIRSIGENIIAQEVVRGKDICAIVVVIVEVGVLDIELLLDIVIDTEEEVYPKNTGLVKVEVLVIAPEVNP